MPNPFRRRSLRHGADAYLSGYIDGTIARLRRCEDRLQTLEDRITSLEAGREIQLSKFQQAGELLKSAGYRYG